MNKEGFFQPWAVRYHHNHLTKPVLLQKISPARTHMLLVPRPQKTPRLLSGNMTNDQFSFLHAHSETVSGSQGLDKALRSIAEY